MFSACRRCASCSPHRNLIQVCLELEPTPVLLQRRRPTHFSGTSRSAWRVSAPAERRRLESRRTSSISRRCPAAGRNCKACRKICGSNAGDRDLKDQPDEDRAEPARDLTRALPGSGWTVEWTCLCHRRQLECAIPAAVSSERPDQSQLFLERPTFELGQTHRSEAMLTFVFFSLAFHSAFHSHFSRISTPKSSAQGRPANCIHESIFLIHPRTLVGGGRLSLCRPAECKGQDTKVNHIYIIIILFLSFSITSCSGFLMYLLPCILIRISRIFSLFHPLHASLQPTGISASHTAHPLPVSGRPHSPQMRNLSKPKENLQRNTRRRRTSTDK